MPEPNIVLVTGERQIGKSTVCRKLVQRLQKAEYQLSGLLTQRTGTHDLEVTELHTAQTYPLTLPFDPQVDRPLGNFLFSPDAVRRSNAAFDTCFPTQIFFLDELGPLELKHHKGWIRVIPMLRKQVVGLAFVVIRPTLLMEAMDALSAPLYKVVRVRQDNRNALPDILYHMVLAEDKRIRSLL